MVIITYDTKISIPADAEYMTGLINVCFTYAMQIAAIIWFYWRSSLWRRADAPNVISFRNSLWWPIYFLNSVDKTKLI